MSDTSYKIIEKDHIKIGKFLVYYDNEDAAKQTVDEIFNDLPYIFQTDKNEPLIIDGGSNIGISCLYFKMQYPSAKIICFEPDPNAFRLLTKNVEVNHLKNVTLINAALARTSGKVNFYGQFNGEHPDARGNSIVDIWGLQRNTSTEIIVDSINLSQYIDCEVDFLKLDIEGAEEQVLEEIKDRLHFVKSIAIEVHQTKQMNDFNDIKKIISLLKSSDFEVNVLEKSTNIMPKEIRAWMNTSNPSLYLVKGSKSI